MSTVSDHPGPPTPRGPDPLNPDVAPSAHHWVWVLCLLGLDYFSTLAYQPSITYEVAGLLGPLATALVVVVTLFGALPIYCYLAGRSPGGQGSLGILERLVHGWRGKTLVLILLGFAATDFTMLKSISLADASVHLLKDHDGLRKAFLDDASHWIESHATRWFGESAAAYCNEQMLVTVILGFVGFFFWFFLRHGFSRNVLYLAVPIVGLYLLLNGALIGAGIWRLADQPEIVDRWIEQVRGGEFLVPTPRWSGEGWDSVLLLSFLFLPSLSLGLSGFELSMIIMPQVEGKSTEPEKAPATRIHNTRKMLVVAGLIMSVYLLGSVLVTTLLVPHAQLMPGGDASNRALAYLAHGGALSDGMEPLLPCCGTWFGLLYDTVTILILCLAGTSVMTALAVLLPMFLLRLGMEFRWMQRWGVLLFTFAAINLLVTVWFKADVSHQRRAYATGVLVLIASASVIAVVDKWKRHHAGTEKPRRSFLFVLDWAYFLAIAAVLVPTMFAVLWRSEGGLLIAAAFVVVILALSVVSRGFRADELRTPGFRFQDDASKFLWDSLLAADFPALVPMRPGAQSAADKALQIRREHQIDDHLDLVLLEVEVGDASNFYQKPIIEVIQEGTHYLVKAKRCVSVPHAIAAIALEMSRGSVPPTLHFGWSEIGMLASSWNYLAFGEGNIPWKVRELIQLNEPDAVKRPRVVIG